MQLLVVGEVGFQYIGTIPVRKQVSKRKYEMNTLSIEERQALRDTVHKLFTDASTEAAVRAVMETESGFDPTLWKQMGQMGVIGLTIDEKFGGSGAGPLELEAVMEEAGAALLCSPLLASGVVAAQLLKALGDASVNQRLLPQIASGQTIASAVITSDSGCWTRSGVSIEADTNGDTAQLSGTGNYVLHGQNADVLIVITKQGDELVAYEVDPKDDAVEIEALPTFDHTLRMAKVQFKGASGNRISSAVPVWDAVQSALNLATVALAGEQAGGARKIFEITVEYAKTRVQFGRIIGSFQAIKHMAADLLIETESATSAARYAATCLAEGSKKTSEAISLAAFACGDAFVKTAADGVQMHGGIAFTWEHPAHLYLKRARADAQLFGSSDFHRENYLVALGG